MTDPNEVFAVLRDEISKVLVGKEDLIEHLTIALLTRGHVLLEGAPGIAKTTTANLFARVLGLEYSRIQMTPDLLPADIIGSHIYREGAGEYEVRKGPIFSNIVVADELNRATAKTQSALLEAMAEGHVTIEGDTFGLPEVFLVIATQTPIEMEGTYELPEVQRDRFQFKLTVNRPTREEEFELLNRFDDDPTLDTAEVDQVLTAEDISTAREELTNVYIDDRVKQYILDFIDTAGETETVSMEVSPRATLAFQNAAKARAAIRGRSYVLPDDIKALAQPILIHRLVLDADAELSGVTTQDIVQELIKEIDAPEAGDNIEHT